ncbi:MAG: dTDP-4-dehydrorhamnose 3,5-epimerase family protein [Deltaproteobacteria bacterium]|nr:dTDP-4-dehydrorhamnose 3,5-epimerase family protein [Deltaproteobacteria bacterium]
MRFEETSLADVRIIRGEPFVDERGTFARTFCRRDYGDLSFDIKQMSISENRRAFTLRGFHFQRKPFEEIKTITPLRGSLYDIVVDLRAESPTYLRWEAYELNSRQYEGVYVPRGCANAWLTLEEDTLVTYCMSEFFAPEHYAGIRYDDPFFRFRWPREPEVVSARDRGFAAFRPGEEGVGSGGDERRHS